MYICMQVVVVYGDWGHATKHKGYGPAPKGRCWRDALRKRNIQVFLADEYNTSKMCSFCGKDSPSSTQEEMTEEQIRNYGKCEKFRNVIRRHKRPKVIPPPCFFLFEIYMHRLKYSICVVLICVHVHTHSFYIIDV